MARLTEDAKDIIRSGALGHLVTTNPDGSPQVTCVWVAVDGDDLLTAHLNPMQKKVENVRRTLVHVSALVENRDTHSRVADATATLMEVKTVVDPIAR